MGIEGDTREKLSEAAKLLFTDDPKVLYHFDHMVMACDALCLKFTRQKFTGGCDV
jgi:hypothetical protein